ncbi:MAG TPA: linear amide C-N hydrolase [Roseiarcus sp.]|jgi:hypothetical protein|nr:linear amide C-N hydrolase [Roseiarcus sp.]
MNKRLIALAMAGALAGFGASGAEACTSLIFKAEDGTRIYARTMEWGASDLKSEMMLVPRAMSFSSALGEGKTGAAWKNKYGFVGFNAAGLAYATDGMNEAGLTVGALFFPGFAKYQEVKADELATTISNVDLVNYILSNFKTVDEVREAMPKIRVVRNAGIEKEFGTPLPLHHIVSDATGLRSLSSTWTERDRQQGRRHDQLARLRLASLELAELCEPSLTPQAARPHASMGCRSLPSGREAACLDCEAISPRLRDSSGRSPSSTR